MQGRTVQLLADVLVLASRRTADFADTKLPDGLSDAEKKIAIAAQQATRDTRDQIVQVLRYTSKNLWVVGDHVKNDGMKNASVPVAELNVSMDSKYIATVCDALVKATMTAFPAVKKTELPAASATPGPKK